MKNLTIILIFMAFSGCKIAKPVGYEMSVDTLRNRNLQLLDKKDIQLIGVDIPVGGSIVIAKNSITRINENQYLVDREIPVIRQIETKFVPMSPTRITTKSVDKSRHISKIKDVDKPKTVTKAKTVKKTTFPWWIFVVLGLAVVLWRFRK